MKIDLQVHSTYSDGYFTPSQLVDFLHKQEIKVAALTDHNTVAGLAEFRRACREKGIRPITGVEIYSKYQNNIFNVLWYNFDDNLPVFHDILRESQVRRRQLARSALKKMAKTGFDIDVDKTLDRFTHYVPLNRVIDEIMKSPDNVKKVQNELGVKKWREEDIIRNYLRNPSVARLRNSLIDIKRLVKLREEVGGQLILCHPAKSSFVRRKKISKLKELGLDGIEALSPHHPYGAVVYIQHLARELDLITSGGSDFHCFEGSGHRIQSASDYFTIDSKKLRRIKELIG